MQPNHPKPDSLPKNKRYYGKYLQFIKPLSELISPFQPVNSSKPSATLIKYRKRRKHLAKIAIKSRKRNQRPYLLM